MGSFNDYRDQAEAALVLGYLNPWTPAKLFEDGANGSWFPTQLGQMFQDAAGTIPVENNDDPIGLILDQSGNGNNATQPTTSLKPKYKTATGSRKYDGSDDRLVTPVMAGSAGNTLAVKTTVPASLAGNAVLIGCGGAADSFFGLGITQSPSSRPFFLVGSVSTSGSTTAPVVNGQTVSIVLVENGTTVSLYVDGTLAFSQAQTGSPITTLPIYEGSWNRNSFASNFYSGEIEDSVIINRPLTAGEITKLANYWS